MRSTKDRRENTAGAVFPLEDSDQELVTEDRRKSKERRLDRLALEERQLLLSEMPWPAIRKPR
jgi:hypothetical protein